MALPAPATLRLFLGLWPADEERAALTLHANAWVWPASARRTPPERLHATLHFLGQVPAERLPALKTGLAVEWEGCDLVLDRPQVWPGGIAVLEAGTVPPGLQRLHAALAVRLAALQVPVDSRRYRPHFTLARKGFGAKPPADFRPLRWRAGPGYRLVQSLPGGGYEAVQLFG